MIFLGLEKINEEKAKVTLIHNFPDMLSEEEKMKGVLVETVPEAKYIENKISILYYDYSNKEAYYECADIPKTQEQNESERMVDLGKSLAEEKLKNIQLTNTVNSLGQELAQIKLQLMQK